MWTIWKFGLVVLFDSNLLLLIVLLIIIIVLYTMIDELAVKKGVN